MTEETKPFTVSDRRHFTPEGAARDEAHSDTDSDVESAAPASEAPSAAAGERDAPVDFASFVLSLGAQAASLLSDPSEGAERALALRQGRSLISILEMLKAKTEGRRDEDEDRVLEALLYELRMAYVASAKAGGA